MEISVNDIRIRMEPCDHCQQMPGEGEALKAISAHHDIMGIQTCSACGEEILPKQYELVHIALPGGEVGWYATPEYDWCDFIMIRESGRRVAQSAPLHLTCAKKALPFLPAELLTLKKGTESSRAIWPIDGSR